MKAHILENLPFFSAGTLFLPVFLVILVGMVLQARADTSLTLVVSNIPSAWGTANGDSVALIGTMNGWTVSDTATVEDHTLTFQLNSVALASMDDWGDKPDGANIGFRFVSPSYPETTLIKTDFRSNDGNFRLALQADTANTVTINASPHATLIDQDSAVWVNGVRETEFTPIDRDRFAFPGGRWKALVMSYDDGHDQDRGLIPIFNQYGIKGTFHLNSGWLDTDTFISSYDVQTIYAPHEVSVHTVDHPDLTYVDDETVRWEVGHCRWVLSELVGYNTDSMSYPMGGYDKRVIAQIAGQGITCSRTVENTFSMDYMPVNVWKWHPTCHHVSAEPFADDFINRTAEQMTLLFIWGHSYELDNGDSNNSWAYMSYLCDKLGRRGDTWYAGMEEVRAYFAAIHNLVYPAAQVIHNPSSSITVWTKPLDRLMKITPGKTITYPAGQTEVPQMPLYAGESITLTYNPVSNALSRAAGVYIHIGHSGWQDVQDIQLARQPDGSFRGTYSIPEGAHSLQWAFFDGETIWDDNGGIDWSASVNCTTTAVPASVNVTEGTPGIGTPASGSENAVGETMDFNTDGGCITTVQQESFGDFGEIYVNSDETYLYLGGRQLNPGGSNNVIMLFLSVDTLSGAAENLWDFSGTPFALDSLHNVGFYPAVNVAILLGDEYGDDTFMHFSFECEGAYDFGQGAFYINSETKQFQPIPGVRLSQYDGDNLPTVSTDDDGNRQTDRWEVAIPWLSLNAGMGAKSMSQIHVSGLTGSDSVSENNRYLSANYLGAGMVGDLDEFGNYGFNFVTLTGLPVGLPGKDSDLDGMPDVWEQKYSFDAADQNDADQDDDSDGLCNCHEYLAGTDPKNAGSVLALNPPRYDEDEMVLQFPTVPGKTYRIEKSGSLFGSIAWQPVSTITATEAETSVRQAPDAIREYYRLKLVIQ